MGHRDARGDVVVEKQLLDGDDVRLQLADEVLHIGADLVEPPAQGKPRRGGDGPIGHHPRLSPVRLHQSEADGGKAGVNA